MKFNINKYFRVLFIIFSFIIFYPFIFSQTKEQDEFIKKINLEIEKIKSNINIKSPVNDYLKIAHLYAQIDEFDNSINYIYRALAIEPQNSRAYYILAMVYEKKKDYKNAIDSWQKCFQYSNNKEIKEIAQKHIDYLSQMK